MRCAVISMCVSFFFFLCVLKLIWFFLSVHVEGDSIDIHKMHTTDTFVRLHIITFFFCQMETKHSFLIFFSPSLWVRIDFHGHSRFDSLPIYGDTHKIDNNLFIMVNSHDNRPNMFEIKKNIVLSRSLSLSLSASFAITISVL